MPPKYRLGMSLADMQARVECGELQLHTFARGFMLTQILNYPEERVLQVQLIWGAQLDEWKHEALAKLREFAAANQCVAIEALCRLGLEKKLAPLGFKRKRILLRVEL